jgi:hypothetical protein
LPTSVQCTRDVSPQSCSFNSVNGEKVWANFKESYKVSNL